MQSSAIQQMQDFFKSRPRRVYPKGQIVLFAGEAPMQGFILSSGRIRVYDITPRGEEMVVYVITAPACFPLSWILNKTPNHFFYKTEVQSVIYTVPMEQLREYLTSHPALLFELLSKTHTAMEHMFVRMVYLMSGSANSKLAYELLMECQQLNALEGDGSYAIHISESDIAARSGLARETVSRELKKLRQKKIIEIKRRTIHISNLEALEDVLQAHPPT